MIYTDGEILRCFDHREKKSKTGNKSQIRLLAELNGAEGRNDALFGQIKSILIANGRINGKFETIKSYRPYKMVMDVMKKERESLLRQLEMLPEEEKAPVAKEIEDLEEEMKSYCRQWTRCTLDNEDCWGVVKIYLKSVGLTLEKVYREIGYSWWHTYGGTSGRPTSDMLSDILKTADILIDRKVRAERQIA